MKAIRLLQYALISAAIISSFYCYWSFKHRPRECLQKATPSTQLIATIPIILPGEYTAKSYDLVGKLKGLSKKQLEDHEELYKKYVNQRNKISKELQTIDRTILSKTWSPFRELKVEETYAINGQILHELYFDNIEHPGITIGSRTKTLIEQNFGSVEAFKKDFMDCAQVSRGWVVTAYSLDDGRLHNYLLEAHNQNIPILIIPLLVLDVYEHAYMIDYGIQVSSYLEVFWNNINWHVVENRLNKWLNIR